MKKKPDLPNSSKKHENDWFKRYENKRQKVYQTQRKHQKVPKIFQNYRKTSKSVKGIKKLLKVFTKSVI